MDAIEETECTLKLKQVEQHLKLYYYPSMDLTRAAFLMSTEEIYLKMQDLFPCQYYFKNDIINIMTRLGFRMFDMGAMDYQWALDYEIT